jgi:hypothetical protein
VTMRTGTPAIVVSSIWFGHTFVHATRALAV